MHLHYTMVSASDGHQGKSVAYTCILSLGSWQAIVASADAIIDSSELLAMTINNDN